MQYIHENQAKDGWPVHDEDIDVNLLHAVYFPEDMIASCWKEAVEDGDICPWRTAPARQARAEAAPAPSPTAAGGGTATALPSAAARTALVEPFGRPALLVTSSPEAR